MEDPRSRTSNDQPETSPFLEGMGAVGHVESDHPGFITTCDALATKSLVSFSDILGLSLGVYLAESDKDIHIRIVAFVDELYERHTHNLDVFLQWAVVKVRMSSREAKDESLTDPPLKSIAPPTVGVESAGLKVKDEEHPSPPPASGSDWKDNCFPDFKYSSIFLVSAGGYLGNSLYSFTPPT